MHHFLGTDNGVQCIRCAGEWSTEREELAPWNCIGLDTDFQTIHGNSTLDESGHSLECEKFAETENCYHLARDYGCNCDYCEYM